MLSEGVVIGLTAAWHTERLCASSLSPSAASVIEAMRVRFKKPTVFQKWQTRILSEGGCQRILDV